MHSSAGLVPVTSFILYPQPTWILRGHTAPLSTRSLPSSWPGRTRSRRRLAAPRSSPGGCTTRWCRTRRSRPRTSASDRCSQLYSRGSIEFHGSFHIIENYFFNIKSYFKFNQLEKLEAAKAAWLVCLSLLSLTGSYSALLSLTQPYLALLSLTQPYLALTSST